MKTQFTKLLLIYMIFFFLILIGICKALGLVVNLTPSLPRGVYLKVADRHFQKGDLVLFCLSKDLTSFGLKRGYLEPTIFQPNCSGALPLQKAILGLPSSNINLSVKSIQVNNEVFHYQTNFEDRQHRRLPFYPRGIYSHAGGYWMIGTHDLHSWDSRYWGPIPEKQILTKVKPLLTFE